MFSRDRFLPAMLGRAHQKPVWPEPGLLLTRRWREMDSNFRFRRVNPQHLRRRPLLPPLLAAKPCRDRWTQPERDRWFESVFLQRGVYPEPVRAGGCRLIACSEKHSTLGGLRVRILLPPA